MIVNSFRLVLYSPGPRCDNEFCSWRRLGLDWDVKEFSRASLCKFDGEDSVMLGLPSLDSVQCMVWSMSCPGSSLPDGQLYLFGVGLLRC